MLPVNSFTLVLFYKEVTPHKVSFAVVRFKLLRFMPVFPVPENSPSSFPCLHFSSFTQPAFLHFFFFFTSFHLDVPAK